MGAEAGVSFRLREFRRWAAATLSDSSYLRPRRLAPCGASEPRTCPLRASRGLIAGETQDDAVEALFADLAGEIPERAKLRLWSYVGPMAILRDDSALELLDAETRSPLWDLIRAEAREGRVGAIYIPGQRQVLIPPVGLRDARARLEATEVDSVVQTRYSNFLRRADDRSDW